MKDFSIKGILFGIIAIIILDIVSIIIFVLVFATGSPSIEMDELFIKTKPQTFLFMTSTITIIVAGYIAAKYGKKAPYKNSLAIGSYGLYFVYVYFDDYSLWFNILSFLTIIPAVLFGAYLVDRNKGHNKTQEPI